VLAAELMKLSPADRSWLAALLLRGNAGSVWQFTT
jgi:hypothetical protein